MSKHCEPLTTADLMQVHETLGALQARFKALKIDGGGLNIGRMQVWKRLSSLLVRQLVK